MDREGTIRAALCGLGMAGLCIALTTLLRRPAVGVDWLTGAGDRAAFGQIAARRGCAVVLARLCGLEALNRAKGCLAGDEALARAAAVLRQSGGPGARLYRVDGRTFALVLPGRLQKAAAQAAARSARAYGAGAAGEGLAVSWAAGPGTVAGLLRRARAGLSPAQ